MEAITLITKIRGVLNIAIVLEMVRFEVKALNRKIAPSELRVLARNNGDSFLTEYRKRGLVIK